MKHSFSKLILASVFLSLIAVSSSSVAATYNVDELIGQAYLANSGEATEEAKLAELLGVDISLIDTTYKDESVDVNAVNDGDAWMIDVDPDKPGFYALKFGTGGLSKVLDAQDEDGNTFNTFFFKNLEDLTKLVFTNDQVLGITGAEDCNKCNIGRLSHYTSLTTLNTVPLPAAVWLFGSAIAGFVGFSRFKKKA